MDTQLQHILRQIHERLSGLYGDRLVHIVLFGSRAREDGDPESDIDVLVVLRGPVNPGDEIARTGEIVAELSLIFDTVISCVFMDDERFLHRNGPLLRNIRREGVLV